MAEDIHNLDGAQDPSNIREDLTDAVFLSSGKHACIFESLQDAKELACIHPRL